MRVCSYLGCETNVSSKKRMYRFPQNVGRCEQWIRACKNPRLIGMSPLKLHEKRLCEDHFADWCFMNLQKKSRLVHNAIPDVKNQPGKREKCDKIASDHSYFAISPSHLSSYHCTDSCSSTTFEMSSTPNLERSSSPISETSSMPNLEIDLSPTEETISTPNLEIGSLYKILEISYPSNLKLRRLKDYKLKKVVNGCYKSKKVSKKEIQAALNKANVDHKLQRFIKRQIQLNIVNRKSHKFTVEKKLFAYNIMCRSTLAYNVLRPMLKLPSMTTLGQFLASKLSKPGMNYDVIHAIKEYLNGQSISKRTFALVFDEIAIKPQLIYNPVADNVSGFEDFGELGRTKLVANRALVFMIKSLQGKKKLPICYYISQGPVTADYLRIIVTDLIGALENGNVCIKAIICNHNPSNCRLFSLLGIIPEKPYFLSSNGSKIVGIYEPSHLLKTLRRNLMMYDLITPQGIVSFKHIISFYEVDQKRERQVVPKLTDKHIYNQGLNSMKVSLASEIFSNSVSAGMSLMILAGLLPGTAAATAGFVGVTNDLFDSMTGTSLIPLKNKKFHCAVQDTSPHLSFWKRLVAEIKHWKFKYQENYVPPQNKKEPGILSSQSGWLQTIASLLILNSELKNCDFKYMMPQRLNQDCLNNFFSQIRGVGGFNTNLTAYQFNSFFKIACVNSLTLIQNNKNCENDMDTFLIDLVKVSNSIHVDDEMSSEMLRNLMPQTINKEINFEQNSEIFDFYEKNILAYLAGYVAFTVQEEIKCDICIETLLDQEKEFSGNDIFLNLKEYALVDENLIGLKYPSENFLECFASMTDMCADMFHVFLYREHLLTTVRRILHAKQSFSFLFCCSENHYQKISTKIVEKTSNLLLKIHLRETNKLIEKAKFDIKK